RILRSRLDEQVHTENTADLEEQPAQIANRTCLLGLVGQVVLDRSRHHRKVTKHQEITRIVCGCHISSCNTTTLFDHFTPQTTAYSVDDSVSRSLQNLFPGVCPGNAAFGKYRSRYTTVQTERAGLEPPRDTGLVTSVL